MLCSSYSTNFVCTDLHMLISRVDLRSTVEMCSVQPHGIREVEFVASSSTCLLAYSSSQPSLPSRSSVQLLAPTPVTQRAACRPPVFHLLIQLNFLHSSAFLIVAWYLYWLLDFMYYCQVLGGGIASLLLLRSLRPNLEDQENKISLF